MFVLVTLNFLFPLEEHPAIIVSWLYLLTFSCEETFNLHSTRHPALSGYMYSQLTASWESDIILYYQNVHLFCNASLWEIGILFGRSCYVYKCKKKWAPWTVVAVMVCQFLRNEYWAKKLNSLEEIYRARTEFPVHALCTHLSTRNEDLIDPQACATHALRTGT